MGRPPAPKWVETYPLTPAEQTQVRLFYINKSKLAEEAPEIERIRHRGKMRRKRKKRHRGD